MDSKQDLKTQRFIKRCNLIHQGKYIYTKTVYTRAKDSVIIICPKHGEFTQTADSHLHGHGCKLCAIEEQHNQQRKKLDEFIENSNIVHNNKYDYSEVEYVNNHTGVWIICPIHGKFKQTPNDHLCGKGCRQCSYEYRGLKHRLTNDSFIKKSNLIHKNKYDYSLTKYEGYDNDVEIICPIHGKYTQSADSHLQGHGCPMCNTSKLELEIEHILKQNNIKYISQCNSRKFPWLGLQSLDFYLCNYNIAIECQGEQHFHYVDFSGINEERARIEFDKCIERDKRKSMKCKENGVRLLYFTKKKFLKNGNNVIDGEYFFNPKDIIKILNDDFDIYKKETDV